MAAYVEDTIVAVATATGRGAIAIVRISGRDALEIAGGLLRPPVSLESSHRARRGTLIDPATGNPLDDVLVLPMLGPGTATGEDVVDPAESTAGI